MAVPQSVKEPGLRSSANRVLGVFGPEYPKSKGDRKVLRFHCRLELHPICHLSEAAVLFLGIGKDPFNGLSASFIRLRYSGV
jgi:hypothetical protein